MAPRSASQRFRLFISVVFLAATLHANATAAQTLVAQITYPNDGATNVDVSQAIQWTAVANIQAYYLYVGTTIGAKDLVDTGEIQQTSYMATGIPGGTRVYARVHTLVGGVWRSTDSDFTTASVAVLTSPVNGTVDADLTQPIQWTAVADVQAYYLYIGTTIGAKDLVDTGEIQQTSYPATGLPGGRQLYARIHVLVAGVWRSTDSSFTELAGPTAVAIQTSPANGATDADLSQPIQWTTVFNAQAYYLYVGSFAGAKDIVDTGELQQTSYTAKGIADGRHVYARLHTLVGGRWRFTDSNFTTGSATTLTVSTLTYPVANSPDADLTQPIQWTTVVNVQAYYLYVGSTAGAKDVIDTGEVQTRSYLVLKNIATGTKLYARIWARVDNVWRYTDSTFTAASTTPEFLYPLDGATAVSSTLPFRWVSSPHSDSQQLRVGTAPGANDVFDSGPIRTMSAIVSGLPVKGTVYARVLSRIAGEWHATDIAFTPDLTASISSMVAPLDGQVSFDTSQPFEWSDVSIARGYRLTIGSVSGGNDLHDSGEIHVTRRFVPSLPIGRLFGRLETKIDGGWQSRDFTFSVTANSASSAIQISSAMWATDLVRRMALTDNRPFGWTVLAATARRATVNCSDYAIALLAVLTEMNVQLSSRALGVALNPNTYDAHTLVEMLDPDSQNWVLLDPTFDVTAKRTADGDWATAEDMSTATRSRRWSDISYVFLGDLGDDYLRGYYLDYPLVFVNIYHQGQPAINGVGGPVIPYLASVPLPITGAQDIYMIGCSGQTSVDLSIDGAVETIDCSGVDRLSHAFWAATIELDASVTLYRPERYVF